MGKKVIPTRTVLDTNVLVSALLFGGLPGKLHGLWVAKRFPPLLSKDTFAEFNKVLVYRKFRLTSAEIAALVEDELLPFAEVVNVAEHIAGTVAIPTITSSWKSLLQATPPISLAETRTCWCYGPTGTRESSP